MIKVGIIAEDTSFVVGELVRLLINHPDVELQFVCTPKLKGIRLCDVYSSIFGELETTFTDTADPANADIIFADTADESILNEITGNGAAYSPKLIDLSDRNRLGCPDNGFVYGLPELNRRASCKASAIANPGNIATCVTLALLPMAKLLMLNNTIWANVITGATDGGRKEKNTYCPAYTPDDISIYRPFTCKETEEVIKSMKQLQNSFSAGLNLIPIAGTFARGTFATVATETKVGLEELKSIYVKYYEEDSFTFLSEKPIGLRHVLNTNKCLLHLDKHGDTLLVTSCMDNLLKGSAGQAVHNMNLMFNLEETIGLHLKGSVF